MNHFIVADCETGGLDETKNPITEFSLSVIDPKKLVVIDSYQTYIKPYQDLVIEQEALDRTQVSMVDINNGITYTKFADEFAKVCLKYTTGTKIKYQPILVGHNIPFDIRFLEQLYKFLNKDLWKYLSRIATDTMIRQKDMELGSKGADKYLYNLTACCERMGIKLHSAHGASADVDATTKLFVKQTKIIRTNSKNDESNSAEDTRGTGKEKARHFFEM